MRILILLYISVSFLFANSLQERVKALINVQTKSYKPRISYDPFINTKKIVDATTQSASVEKSLLVMAILNNKAYIESKWRSVGDEFLGYKVLQINVDSVLVKKEKKIVKLKFKKANNVLKVRNKI